jgi:hypothetical protein
MVHLQALPGSPKFSGDWQAVLNAARRDAAALAEGGADAIMVENFNDAPFFKCAVPRITVAAMTAAAGCVKEAASRLPVGVNVLRNDGRAALAVALAVGCDFIRVNVLCGARVTDQGIIEGIAARLLRERHWLGAEHVAIWADVDVKHSAPLGPGRSVEDEVADLLERGGAEALIVSGAGTGKPADPAQLARVKTASAGHPVLIGSGATLQNLHSLRPHCDGLIVGTALKSGSAIDIQRVRSFAEALEAPADPPFAPNPAAR